MTAICLSRLAFSTRPLTSSTCLRHRAIAPAAQRPAVPRPAHLVAVRAMGAAASSDAEFTAQVQQKNSQNPVVVYSKTYCPYCSEVKGLFEKLGVAAKVIELDELADGSKVQDAVTQLTGRRTVPQVFVGGQHVGGCDDTMAAMRDGKLKALLEAAGVQAKL